MGQSKVLSIGHVKSVVRHLNFIRFQSNTTIHHIPARTREGDLFKYEYFSRELERDLRLFCTLDPDYKFETRSKKRITFLEAPDHPEFVRHFVVTHNCPDALLFVVPAPFLLFEEFLKLERQIQLLVVSLALGVGNNLVVAVEKMDDKSVQWNQKHFKVIVDEISQLLRKIGFDPDLVSFIPISGFHGDNLDGKSPNTPWYSGPSLAEALDRLPFVDKDKMPLRIPIKDIFKVPGIGNCVSGTVTHGALLQDTRITFAPHYFAEDVQMRYFETRYGFDEYARTGDDVAVVVARVFQKRALLQRGLVLGENTANPPRRARYFKASLTVLHTIPDLEIVDSYSAVVCCHAAEVVCTFELDYKVHIGTENITEKYPKKLIPGDSAIVSIVPTKSLCVYPQLCFVVQHNSKSVAVGQVLSVAEIEPNLRPVIFHG